MVRAAQKVCYCTICLRYTTTVEGVKVNGQRISITLWRDHQEQQKRRDLLEASTSTSPLPPPAPSPPAASRSQAQSAENALNDSAGMQVMDRMYATSKSQGPPSLPVRPRDRQHDAPPLIVPTATPKTPLKGPAVHDHDAPLPATPREAAIRNVEIFRRYLEMAAGEFDSNMALEWKWTASDLPNAEDPPPPLKALFGSRNAEFLTHSFNIRNLLSDAERRPVDDAEVLQSTENLIQEIKAHLSHLEDVLSRAWIDFCARKEMATVQNVVYNTEKFFRPRDIPSRPYMMCAMLLAVVAHIIFGVSIEHSHFILTGLRAILNSATASTQPDHDDSLPNETIPRDIRTAMRKFGLEPEIVKMACCPKCMATYAPDENLPDLYPTVCIAALLDDEGLCNTPLFASPSFEKNTDQLVSAGADAGGDRKKRAKARARAKAKVKREEGSSPAQAPELLAANRPPKVQADEDQSTKDVPRLTKAFSYQTLSSWLGRFMSRPGIEKNLGKPTSPPAPSHADSWRDVWDAQALRDLKGPNGKPYSDAEGSDLHLAFSLYIDWFNPFGNKKAGKAHSSGAIYLVCLNLPVHLRYLEENMFLFAVMPGPKEPDMDQINHFLKPLVDTLLPMWFDGLLLSQTHDFTTGRLVRCAIVPLIADILALRKVMGTAGHAANLWCNFCLLPKSDATNFDVETWGRRTWQEHVLMAWRYRDARSKKERDKIFQETFIRWSELLRLPYWDPTKYPVVDAMHNLFLGECQHHARMIWGINVKSAQKDLHKLTEHTPAKQRAELDTVANGIRKGSVTQIKRARAGYIVAMAQYNGVRDVAGRTKADYAAALIEWYRQDPSPELRVPQPAQENVKIFSLDPERPDKPVVIDLETLQTIRSDIVRTTLPAHFARAPGYFGEPSHGKLSADQWRTVCLVNLPITLIRLWTSTSATARERELLKNFLDMVIAVDIGTRRSTSPERIALYARYMRDYLEGVVRLFPDHQLVINHHLAQHLPEVMRLFGPVHGVWAFIFERYLGVLRGFNTNSRAGEMELTFLRYFCMSSNLRAFMQTVEFPDLPTFKEWTATFHVAMGRPPEVQEYHLEDASHAVYSYDATKARALPNVIYESLCRRIAWDSQESNDLDRVGHPIRSIEHFRVKLSTPRRATGNSYVIFTDPLNRAGGGATSPHRAGQICDIFLHRRFERGDVDRQRPIVQPFLVVKEYAALTPEDRVHDHYQDFAHLGASLRYNHFSPEVYVLKPGDVVSHFASFVFKPDGIAEKCVVVKSLDRA